MTEEALRQQKKHLQELAMDDYLDDEMMEDWQKRLIHMTIKTHCHQPSSSNNNNLSLKAIVLLRIWKIVIN